MGIKVITPPTGEQVLMTYARLQLGLDDDGDSPPSHPLDALIAEKIIAAREYCEDHLGLSLAPQTLELALDSWTVGTNTTTGAIELPHPPIVSITSVVYVDSAGAEQTLAADQYVLDNYQLPGWLLPAYGVSWPSTYAVANAVKVRYVAGYSLPDDSPSTNPLPSKLREAMVVLMTDMVHGRGAPSAAAREAAHILMALSRVRLGV